MNIRPICNCCDSDCLHATGARSCASSQHRATENGSFTSESYSTWSVTARTIELVSTL